MFKNLLQNWNFMRIIRLVIGGYALVEAIRSQDTLMGLLGFVLVGMAILNVGCGAQRCGVPNPRNSKTSREEVTYEEIHSK
jgi:hypothetical protein